MSPRPNVTDERKRQILNAAEDVFTKKGFDQARMDDIAEKTGLSKGTLYLYFKSKNELITAILDRIFQREFEAIEKADLAALSAAEAIWLITEAITKDVRLVLRLMPLAYEFLALAFRNKVVQEALRAYLSRYMGIFVPIVQRGIDRGEFRPVDPHEVGVACGAIFEGTILLWVYDKSMVEPERHIRSGMRLLLEGLQVRS